MKSPAPLRLLALIVLLATSRLLHADDTAIVAAVRAADDERVAATLAVDAARMDAIFSADLHYAHSNGNIDDKASYIDSILKGRSVYRSYDYKVRKFIVASPDVVLMPARVLIEAGDATKQNLLDLKILAVWRNEGGKWRFLAWQSSRVPPPPAK